MENNSQMEEDLKIYTIKLANHHAKISRGEVPADEDELDDQVDDMWYAFAIPDFENNPEYDDLQMDTLFKKLKLEDIYKQTAKEALINKHDLSF